MKLLAITLIGIASAELGDILSSKQDATQLIREKRGFTFCKQLGDPECWEKFSEEVYQPRVLGVFKNKVKRREGKALY